MQICSNVVLIGCKAPDGPECATRGTHKVEITTIMMIVMMMIMVIMVVRMIMIITMMNLITVVEVRPVSKIC